MGGRQRKPGEAAKHLPAVDDEFENAWFEALSHPKRALLAMARAGDRVPLADYLKKGAADLRLLNERRSLQGERQRQHILMHQDLERRAKQFLQGLVDPELLSDLSRLVRAGKMSGPKWIGSKRLDRRKFEAWAAVWSRIDASAGKITDTEAIRAVADDKDVLRELGLDHDNAETRIRNWFYEAKREADDILSDG
ncbi:MAG: hypothetical protein WBO29_01730 [Albidovulum sp.]